MAKTEQILSIFLASPGDVGAERNSVNAFVNEWNDLWSDEIGVHLRLVRWETHAYPAGGADGQDVINAQIGEEYDVFLGIMWKRFGTPTGRAASGTVEEFERALARNRASGSPELMFYFKKAELDPGVDAEQLLAVREFRGKLANDGLLYWEFLSHEQFDQLVRVHLTRHVQNWAKRHRHLIQTQHATQIDWPNRYASYLHTVKNQSAILSAIIIKFAKAQLAYNNEISRRAAEAQAMTNETPDLVWKLALIEIAHAMIHYADEAEKFEANFTAAFSVFVEGVLGAAAVSIALPSIKTKKLKQVLDELRGKLRGNYKAMGDYIAARAKNSSQLSGAMLTSNERSIAALSNVRDHAKFGERLLLESEKLFDAKQQT
jgi:hypothetical protein